MFLRHGYVISLYIITLLSLLEVDVAARSTSFLPFASGLWGSISTGPSLAPTSNPLRSKRRRRKPKRRRKLSPETQKTRIQLDDRDQRRPKKRKRKRKTSSGVRTDVSGSAYYPKRVYSSGRERSEIRPARRTGPVLHERKVKRRRSSRANVANQSTETKVRKTKKAKRQRGSDSPGSMVAPMEKWKDRSEPPVRKKKRSKRRKQLTVSKQSLPRSSPVDRAATKKRKVKRTKKRRRVSPNEPEISEIDTPHTERSTRSEEVEESSPSSHRMFALGAIDVESAPTDKCNAENNLAINEEILVDTDPSPSTQHQQYGGKSLGGQLSVDIQQENVSIVNAKDDHNDVTVATTEIELKTSISEQADGLVINDGPNDANAEVSNCTSTVQVRSVSGGEGSGPVERHDLDEITDSSTTIENKVGDNDETEEELAEQKQEDNLPTVDVVSVESKDSSNQTQMDALFQPQIPREAKKTDTMVDGDTEEKIEPEIYAGANEDKSASTGKEEDGVVDFIEDILQEDVKSWVEESSSDTGTNATSVLKDTRGGHQSCSVSTHKDIDVNDASNVRDSPQETAGKENEKETLVKDTSTESVSVHPSVLESSEDSETDITVSVVTWNLAEISPAEEDAAFIRKFRKSGIKKGSGSDLVLISGQECENIKPRRSEGSRSREYRRLMIKMLGKQYVPIALHLLGGIQFGLFAKRSFLKEIEEISIADVTCGIGNVFHNKGAIAAFLKVKARNPTSEGCKAKSLRMIFVTAHMAAHVKNVDARNSDFWRISSELEAQAPDGFLPGHDGSPDDLENESFLFNSADRVFFCGDLNYRVDLPRELAEFDIVEEGGIDESENPYAELMYHDQLKAVFCENHAFTGFVEGKIEFAPTFKFDKDTGSYDTSHKQRIPAWTDRILFKPFGTRVLEYRSVPEAQHSDHRPVYGTFRVSMEGRDLPSKKSRTRKRRERRPRKEME